VTTHYLEESEQCNRLGFMAGGELVAQGTPSGIKSAQTGHLLEFIVDQPQHAADVLKSDTSVGEFPYSATVFMSSPMKMLRQASGPRQRSLKAMESG